MFFVIYSKESIKIMPKTLKPTAAEVLAKLQVLTGAQNSKP